MFQARYPYTSAGSRAVLPFAALGAIGGVLAAFLLPPNFPAPINAFLWLLIGAAAGFLIFAAEAPRRPPAVGEAVVADGVVAGISLAVTGTIFDLAVASHLGGTGGSHISFGGGLGNIGLSAILGAVSGAAMGGVLLAATPREGWERLPPARARRKGRRKKGR